MRLGLEKENQKDLHMETGEKRRRIRMKPVLLGMLAMLLTSEPVSGKHSFYVKLEPQARKALPAMKAGTVSGAGVYESGRARLS